jgi:hypothetical protein
VFGAALWGLDYALQMAHSNFSGAMFHVGGQNVFYNVCTVPRSVPYTISDLLAFNFSHLHVGSTFLTLLPILPRAYSSSHERIDIPPVDHWTDLLLRPRRS